jgi:hypothetical protein
MNPRSSLSLIPKLFSMAKWFYIVDGKPNGPIDSIALKQLAFAGDLKPTDKVRPEDVQVWFEANRVKELFSSVQPQPNNDCVSSVEDSREAPSAKLVASDSWLTDGIPDTLSDDVQRTNRITAALGRLRGERGFYLHPHIPQRKSTKARKNCAVFSDDDVIGLIDCTVLGSGSNALVFGKLAFYYHNGGGNVPDPGCVPYIEFPAINFSPIYLNCITLGGPRYCNKNGSSIGRDRIIETLNEIKDVFMNDRGSAIECPSHQCPHCGMQIPPEDSKHAIRGHCPYCSRDLTVPPLHADGHRCPKCDGNDIKSFEFVHALGKSKTTGSLALGGGSTASIGSILGAGLGAAYASGRIGSVTGLGEMCAPPEKAKWAALSPERQEFNERIHPKKVGVWKRSWICMTCGSHWVASV